MAALPDLHVSDSSEAMLSGRKPPFRLLVRAAHRDGRKVNIRHAVSEGFVVSLLGFYRLLPLMANEHGNSITQYNGIASAHHCSPVHLGHHTHVAIQVLLRVLCACSMLCIAVLCCAHLC